VSACELVRYMKLHNNSRYSSVYGRIGMKRSVGVDVQILMRWRHWTPKIERLGVLDARQ